MPPSDPAIPDRPARPAQSLTHRVAKGASWMVAMQFSVRAIGVVSTVILARLLIPEDFGVVAVAMLVYGIVEVMGQFGFETVLVRDKDADRRDYDTAWTLILIRAVVFAGILALAAPFAAGFFGDPRIEDVIYVLAGIALIDGLKNIGVVDFEKKLAFHKLFQLRLYRKLTSFTVTVTCAFLIMNYWALVIGIVAGRAVQLALSYIMSPYRPRLSLARWRKLLGFSVWLLLKNLALYARNNADKGIVGRLLDAASLGLFTVAKELAELPSSQLIAPMQTALLPGYAKIGADRSALSHAYVRTFSTIMMVTAPIGLGMALLAEPLVLLALGEKWIDVIPILQILAIHGTLMTMSTSAGAVFLAIGKPQIPAYLAIASLLYSIPLLVLGGLHHGLVGVAAATVLCTGINAPIMTYAVTRHIGVRPKHLVKAVWRSLFSLSAMVATVWYVAGPLLPEAGSWQHPAVVLAAGTLAGAAVYGGVHLALWWVSGRPRSAEHEVLAFAQAVLRRHPAAAAT